MLTGVPQDSIPHPLLTFSWIRSVLIVIHSHLNNYANGNTLYCFCSNTNDVNDKLRIDLVQIMESFNNNYMVLNAEKLNYVD